MRDQVCSTRELVDYTLAMFEVESSVGASQKQLYLDEHASVLNSMVMHLMLCHSGRVVLAITYLSKHSQHTGCPSCFGPTPHLFGRLGCLIPQVAGGL